MSSELWIPPPFVPDLSITAYFDASGGADKERHWACVWVKEPDKAVLRKGLADLKAKHPKYVDTHKHELKNLSTVGIVEAVQYLKMAGIPFFPYKTPAYDAPGMSDLIPALIGTVKGFKPHPSQPDPGQILRLHRRALKFLEETNDNAKNKHKLASIIALCNRWSDDIRIKGLGRKLRAVTLYIDDENFKEVRECAWLLKFLLVASLQWVGMSNKLNGNAGSETSFRGNVRVTAKGPSHRIAGIQFADIVARASKNGILKLMGY